MGEPRLSAPRALAAPRRRRDPRPARRRRAARRRCPARAHRHRRLHGARRRGVRLRRPASGRRHEHPARDRARRRRAVAAGTARAARPRRDGRRCCPPDDAEPRSSTPRRWSSARSCAPRALRAATHARIAHALRVARRGLPRHRRRAPPAGALRGQRPSGARRGARSSCGMPRPTRFRSTDVIADWPDAHQRDRAITRSPTTGSSSSIDGIGATPAALNERECRSRRSAVEHRRRRREVRVVEPRPRRRRLVELARLDVRVGVAGVLSGRREPGHLGVALARLAQQRRDVVGVLGDRVEEELERRRRAGC